MDTPPELLIEENRSVLAYLEGLSAHGDVVEVLLLAVKPLGDVQFFCPDRSKFRYVVASTRGVIFAFAVGMGSIAFRLDTLMKSRAMSTGAEDRPDCGPDWVSLIPFRSDWPQVDFEFWARKAYVHVRENLRPS